jgi:hypothetical protein
MEPNAMGTPPMLGAEERLPNFRRAPNTFGAPPAPNTNPVGAFGATNNLIGSQVNPTNSAQTNTAQGYSDKAGSAYNSFQLSPFQGVQPLAFGAERGMLGAAGTQMAGLNYNTAGANAQYGAAQSGLAGAAAGSQAALQGLQGRGGFGGGGANTADFSRADGLVGETMGRDVGQNFDYGGDTGAARGLASSALSRAMNAPDRNALASESLSLLEERSRPGYDQTLRQVGAKNAAMGRRGSGVTTNELGDVTLGRERELGLARRDLANEASSRTMQDNSDRVNLSMGVTQGLGAEDRGKAGVRQGAAGITLRGAEQLSGNAKFNAAQAESSAQRNAQGAQFGASFERGLANDIYGMGRDQSNLAMDVGDRYGQQDTARVGLGERQAGFTRGLANDTGNFTRDEYGAGVDERNTSRRDEYDQGDFARTKFGDMRGYLGDERSNDRSNRNEIRNERNYQYGLSRDAIGDEYDRADFEERLRGNRYNRGMGTTNVGFGGQSPSGAYSDSANQYRQSSADNFEGAGQSLASMGNRRSGAGSGR